MPFLSPARRREDSLSGTHTYMCRSHGVMSSVRQHVTSQVGVKGADAGSNKSSVPNTVSHVPELLVTSTASAVSGTHCRGERLKLRLVNSWAILHLIEPMSTHVALPLVCLLFRAITVAGRHRTEQNRTDKYQRSRKAGMADTGV